MSAYGPKDRETPQTLLDETVCFTGLMLDLLMDADILPSRFCNSVSSLSFQCLPAGVPQHVVDIYTPHSTVIRRNGFDASHPAVVDAFMVVVKDILTRYGFNDQEDKKPSELNFGDFVTSCTRGGTSVSSFSIAIQAETLHIRRALRMEDQRLEQLCINALETVFSDMADFNKAAQKKDRNQFPHVTPPKGFGSAPVFGLN